MTGAGFAAGASSSGQNTAAKKKVIVMGAGIAGLSCRMVKILESTEGPRFSMMDVEDEHNHMRAAFGLCYRFGQPGTPAAE
jgi:hypothetical protein